MKKGTYSFGIVIPFVLIALTLLALVLMNYAHASTENLLWIF